MKPNKKILLPMVLCSIGVLVFAAIASQGVGPSQDVKPGEPEIFDASPEIVKQFVKQADTLSDEELRHEVGARAASVFRAEQFAAFIHAMYMHEKDKTSKLYRTWRESSWNDPSVSTFVNANLLGHVVRKALDTNAGRIHLEDAFVAINSKLCLIEQANTENSRGVLLTVYGYASSDLLLEAWPAPEDSPIPSDSGP